LSEDYIVDNIACVSIRVHKSGWCSISVWNTTTNCFWNCIVLFCQKLD